MRNFQGTFETPKQSFISAFSICMTVPLRFDMDTNKLNVKCLSIMIVICIKVARVVNLKLVFKK